MSRSDRRGAWAKVMGRCLRWGAVGAVVGAALVGSACASHEAPGFGAREAIAAERPPLPAREYRGVWVASVGNIDWPSKPALGVEAVKSEINRVLDMARELNINSVFVQVRPACDALYRSSIEPWSYYLTGAQGQTPDESFDPLRLWIDGAHQRGIELHAWINPFRARPKNARYELAPTHIARTRPDLVREYDDSLWLDPGEPEALQHSLRVLDELVRSYNIDGLHFDDYFYPYPTGKAEFPDDPAYAKYQASGGALARDAWRRANIDGFVERVYDQTKHIRPECRVSVSPFGIWRPNNPKGVQGFDAYAGLSADSRRWLCEGWLDMAIPQLYWKIDAKKQPYAELLNWWLSQNACGRLVVVGNFTSRVNDTAQSWQPAEIVNQVERTRQAGAGGNVHFSAIAILENRKGLADVLREGVYAQPALTPLTPWLSAGRPRPGSPRVAAEETTGESGAAVYVEWSAGFESEGALPVRSWVLQERRDGRWQTRVLGPHTMTAMLERVTPMGTLEAFSVAACDTAGRLSAPAVRRDAPRAVAPGEGVALR